MRIKKLNNGFFIFKDKGMHWLGIRLRGEMGGLRTTQICRMQISRECYATLADEDKRVLPKPK